MEAATRPGTARAGTPSRAGREGHGRRLTRAREALEVFPALAASRDRLFRVVGESQPSVRDIVSAVESDPALAISVLRLANHRSGPGGGKVTSVRDGVELLGPVAVEDLAERTDVSAFFERTPTWDVAARAPSPARRGRAARRRPDRPRGRRTTSIATSSSWPRSYTTSASWYSCRPIRATAVRSTATPAAPEARLRAERRELGVDHALVVGVLARRWALPSRLASIIERHHADEALGEIALVRLADMLAHYVNDQPGDPNQVLRTARAVGLDGQGLRSTL